MTSRRGVRRFGLSVTAVAVTVACSGTTTEPTPVTNTPPTITLLTTATNQIEAGDEVAVDATVTDAETPVDQLTYTWSATPSAGTFTGSGAHVKWKAPAGGPTPSLFTLMVTVTEKYKSGSTQKENTVSTTEKINYNDSPAEIGGLVTQFLKDFGTYSVSPEMCVRNFSDSCRGKADELSDIKANRSRVGVQILDATSSIGSIAFNGNKTSADIVAPCTFRDQYADGKIVTVIGSCLLGAIYENLHWALCYSNFQCFNCNQLAIEVKGFSLKYMVP
jgi:hypothetical protein